MIEIFAIPVSLYCAKLRILLRCKQLEWREIPPPGGYGSDEYDHLVPSGNLPALRDGDLLLADSEAIAEYLEEKYPLPSLLPDSISERAKIRERSRFHDTRLEPELRKLFSYIAPDVRNATLSEVQSHAISAKLNAFARLQLHSGRRSDDRLTLGDCGFPITFAWIDALTPVLGLSIVWPQAVVEYRERVEQHSAVADELASYAPALERWLCDDI